MRFLPTAIADLWLIRPQRHSDARGSFTRMFCQAGFAAHGLPTDFMQCSVSRNVRAGTLRGLHWQAAPHQEGKLVRCSRGAVFDVAVDLRPGSPTIGGWVAIQLTEETGDALFIPLAALTDFKRCKMKPKCPTK